MDGQDLSLGTILLSVLRTFSRIVDNNSINMWV